MKFRPTSSILAWTILTLIAALASPAGAQAPLLQVSLPTPRMVQMPNGAVGHSWKVLLTNNYRYPVTAYAVRFATAGRHRGEIFDDSVPGHEGLRPPLPPGQTASIVVGGTADEPPTVVNTGVIYADGATAGAPEVVAGFLKARAVYLAELAPTITRLNAVAQDPGADAASVLAHFEAQTAAEKNLIRGTVLRHTPPRVAGAVVENLAHPMPGMSLQKNAAALAAMFRRWEVQLRDSKPKLEAIAFPQVP